MIKLNFKSLKSKDWEHVYDILKEEWRMLFESKRYVLDILNDREKKF